MTDVLVVVDMQRDFIDGSLGTSQAVAVVPEVVSTIEQFQGKIYYTLDTHDENYLQTQEGKKLPVVHCVKGTIGWQLAPTIEKALREKQAIGIEKETFGSTKLMQQLQKEQLTSITFVGVCTDICVISNALLAKAYFPEVPIRVIESNCAGVTAQSHNQAIATMVNCQIEIQ